MFHNPERNQSQMLTQCFESSNITVHDFNELKQGLMKYEITYEISSSSHLDLFIGGYSTKNYFCEALRWKHPEADSPNHTAVFDQRQCLVLSVCRGSRCLLSSQKQ